MDVKDHTEQIQYFTQNKEWMILLPSPAYEPSNIFFTDDITQIFYTKVLDFVLFIYLFLIGCRAGNS